MFEIGDKAYFSEDTLRRVRKENWKDQGRHWSPFGLTPGMVSEIIKNDYIIVGGSTRQKEGFVAKGYIWAYDWFKEPIPNELQGAIRLV